MPGQQIRLLKIFIASPGDVKLEREKAREEIFGLQPVAQKLGYMLGNSSPLFFEMIRLPSASADCWDL